MVFFVLLTGETLCKIFSGYRSKWLFLVVDSNKKGYNLIHVEGECSYEFISSLTSNIGKSYKYQEITECKNEVQIGWQETITMLISQALLTKDNLDKIHLKRAYAFWLLLDNLLIFLNLSCIFLPQLGYMTRTLNYTYCIRKIIISLYNIRILSVWLILYKIL